jgi:hypothetical protein
MFGDPSFPSASEKARFEIKASYVYYDPDSLLGDYLLDTLSAPC